MGEPKKGHKKKVLDNDDTSFGYWYYLIGAGEFFEKLALSSKAFH